MKNSNLALILVTEHEVMLLRTRENVVMNMKFMMEFTNSRSAFCEFLLNLSLPCCISSEKDQSVPRVCTSGINANLPCLPKILSRNACRNNVAFLCQVGMHWLLVFQETEVMCHHDQLCWKKQVHVGCCCGQPSNPPILGKCKAILESNSCHGGLSYEF